MRELFKHPGFVVPLITAVLYLFGTTFYAGFLRKFGLEESQFPLTFDAIIFHGFYVFTELTAYNFKYILIIFIVFILLTMALALIKYKRSVYLKSHRQPKFDKKVMDSEEKEEFDKNIDIISKFYTYPIVLFLVFLGILLILVFAGKSGEKYSEFYIKNIETFVYKPNELILNNRAQPYITYTVACNSSECAYYSNSEVQVIRKSEILSQTISISK